MRRILSALLITLLLAAAFPLSVFAATMAQNVSATTNEDTAVTVTLIGRDSTGGAPITLFTTGAAAHGTVGAPGPITCETSGAKKCNADVLYTPNANYNGADSFQYTATGPAGPDTATASITIAAVNDAPVCTGTTNSGGEDATQSGTVVCTDVDGNSLTYSRVADAASGSATVAANGDWTYSPAADYHGPDSFTFRANDGSVNSNTATMSITVTPVNDAPVCTDDSSSGVKNQVQSGTLACTDVDGDGLAYTKVAGPTHGVASVASNGDWSYTPTTNYSGPDSFTFKADDGALDSNTATMSLTVSPTNAAPVCGADSSSGAEDTDQTGTVSCTDADDDSLTYAKVSGPGHGTATVNSDGTWSYSPTADYHGPDSFTFRANDGSVNSNTATMSITVTAVNDAPVCGDDSSGGVKNQVQTGTVTCTDVDGDSLTYAKVGGPSHGLASVASNGDWTYTPTTNYSGPDSFTFSATDGSLDSNTATMSLTVAPTNAAPVCGADSSSGAEDTDQTGTVSCTDADDDSLTYAKVSGPGHGTATVNSDGTWSYSPTADYHGPDSFTFRANDGSVNSNTATMSITVTAVNDAPVCGAGTTSGPEDTEQTGTLSCTDVDSGSLSYALVDDATHGIVTVLADGSWSYTPAADYNGPDNFTFKAHDGALDSNTATMSLTVTAMNDAPVCGADSSSGAEDADQTGSLSCTDVDGDTITYAKVSGPGHGTATVDTDGSWSYTPAADYNGPDSFTFKAHDGALDSNTATMSLTVTAMNDAPVCGADSSSGAEDADQTGSLSCTDVDGDTITYAKVSGPGHGTATVDTDGSWSYTPAADYNGPDSFTFKAHDGALDSSTATMTITVTAVNDAPTCTGLALETAKNVAVGGTVACSDIEDDTLTLRIGTPPASGTVFPFNPTTGAFTYTPDLGTTGSDTFTVIANDGTDDSVPALVGIGVANHAPTCADATPPSGNEDTQQGGNLVCGDTDVDTLFYSIVDQPTHGIAAINLSSGHWTYTPDQDYNGPDSFTAGASDGADASNAATIDVTVDPVNDKPVCLPASFSGTEEQPLPGTISCTDVDLGVGSLTYAHPAPNPTKGAIISFDTATGDWTYKGNLNRNGADSFTVTASDGLLTSAPATISLTIADVNDPPVAKETKPRIVKATTTTSLPVLADDSAGPLEPTDTIRVTGVKQAFRGAVSIGSGGANVAYNPSGCLYGGDTFGYTITDGGSLAASANVLVTVARPGTNGLSKKPITDAPAVAFVTGSTIGSTIPTKLTWCGVTASGTSIRSYRLEQSTNGGSSYGSVLFKKTTAKSSTRSLKAGTAYRWRARSTDKAGRVGSFRSSSVSRLTLTQETSASVSYPTGTWTASPTTSASGGSERFAAAAGASASMTLPSTARAFAIVGPRSKSLGSFDVFVDDIKVATVTEKASVTGTQYRHVLYSRSLGAGTHTVKIVTVGTTRVYLDAFLSLGS